MKKLPYNAEIAKWGRFARALLKHDTLVQLFVKKGIFPGEIEKVSTTELTAEAADRAQADAYRELGLITDKIQKVKAGLLELFSDLRLRFPNVANDLEKEGDAKGAEDIRKVKFSVRAIPRVPKEGAQENGENEEADENEDALDALEAESEETEESDEEKPLPAEDEEAKKAVEDRESRAQEVLASCAQRLARFLAEKPNITQALVNRMMPPDFVTSLNQKAEELLDLRDQRVMAIVKWKRATQTEYLAVAEHIKAKNVIEPTATKLASEDDEIDALMVEHLKRKSLRKPNPNRKKKKKKKEEKNQGV